jgi:hypothetical protein
MPQSTSFRKVSDGSSNLPQEELYRLYGPDYDEMRWVRETLERLGTRRLSLSFSERDEADLKRVGTILDRRRKIARFGNPYHDPKNGQFTSGFNLGVAIAQLH